MADFSASSMNFNFFIIENKESVISGGDVVGEDYTNLDSIIGQYTANGYGGTVLGSNGATVGGESTVMTYIQRIFDITLNQFVYYKLVTKTSAPSSTQTTPNHTGNLLVSSHEVVLVVSELI